MQLRGPLCNCSRGVITTFDSVVIGAPSIASRLRSAAAQHAGVRVWCRNFAVLERARFSASSYLRSERFLRLPLYPEPVLAI
jgi:hypothetical protein